MMMSLGFFVFERKSAPFQELNRENTWRYASNDRLGARPVRQYIGEGDDIITLNGELRPEITGGRLSLEALRTMAGTGEAYVLVDGTGTVHGFYIIERLGETQREFFEDGTPRAIHFSLTLKRTDDGLIDTLGDLAASHNGALA